MLLLLLLCHGEKKERDIEEIEEKKDKGKQTLANEIKSKFETKTGYLNWSIR